MSNRENVRVLIAEDDYLVGETIKEMLKEVGYTVVGKAMDGLQAVEMTARLVGTPTQPDVILMDIKMPGIGGVEATRRIYDRCPTPVVMLTAYETEELVAEASAAGAGAYLVKPPEAHEMKRAIMIAMARFDDMVALQQSNRRLEETLAELRAMQQQVVQQERLAAVGQLAAGIAHEFNNIVTAIILYADMMLRTSTLAPTDREQLTTIRQEGHHAARLTQQILDFGRKAMLQRQDLDLLPFMEALKGLLHRTLPENIHIHLNCNAKEIMVNADPDRLQQAVMNVALNAQEAMPEGGDLYFELDRSVSPPLPLAGGKTPAEDQGEQWARLTVTDTGSGIPPNVLPHIFEPFFTTRAPLGSGLGLPQAYGIVKQHGGHIDVSSEVGEGTIITIYLPALPLSQPRTSLPETTTMPEGDGETILVVEDNPGVRQALAYGLETLNYRVLAASGAQEALALFEQHSGAPSAMGVPSASGHGIALVLSDLAMPRIGGMALCQALKKRDPATRTVILTDYPLEGEEKDWESAGVVDWVQKPVDIEQLAQTIARALKIQPDE